MRMMKDETGRGMRDASLKEILHGVSRKIGRHIPFRPHWLNLPEATIAFTFDDFPVSAYETAAPVLEAAGMRGTFYLATGLMGRTENGQPIATAAMAADLAARGHEIGGHTHGHINVQRTPRAALLADVAENEREIRRITRTAAQPFAPPVAPALAGPLAAPGRPFSFAYPFGMVSTRSKLALMGRYPGLRGIGIGINHGLVDLAHLKAQELYDTAQDRRSLGALLDEARARRGWLIFYTHDVRENPTAIGCSPALFRAAVEEVAGRGMRVETVAETLARIGARQGG
ncbi:polysaccharide deacetylase family protein [Rhizobium sp. CSW-27]|uniref:polysaccharide deacetylase family protein n=1 Tax=Rhizobium sp. CSW-27 TaxID=2839985 RepID=UPI001C0226DB|nr:polysaccharide deacetylase family protein [Rhizobium sp. CSW-27]MBT9372241.1 polysaccharide deacetylase family protein [Rhizobium sp. CSW-27]